MPLPSPLITATHTPSRLCPCLCHSLQSLGRTSPHAFPLPLPCPSISATCTPSHLCLLPSLRLMPSPCLCHLLQSVGHPRPHAFAFPIAIAVAFNYCDTHALALLPLLLPSPSITATSTPSCLRLCLYRLLPFLLHTCPRTFALSHHLLSLRQTGTHAFAFIFAMSFNHCN